MSYQIHVLFHHYGEDFKRKKMVMLIVLGPVETETVERHSLHIAFVQVWKERRKRERRKAPKVNRPHRTEGIQRPMHQSLHKSRRPLMPSRRRERELKT